MILTVGAAGDLGWLENPFSLLALSGPPSRCRALVLTTCYGIALLQGRIACANVLSDLYAMGVTECDNMLMLLGVSSKMSEKV